VIEALKLAHMVSNSFLYHLWVSSIAYTYIGKSLAQDINFYYDLTNKNFAATVGELQIYVYICFLIFLVSRVSYKYL